MIKVLLVDDESMALEYLKNLTDWEGNVMDESDELQTFIHSR